LGRIVCLRGREIVKKLTGGGDSKVGSQGNLEAKAVIVTSKTRGKGPGSNKRRLAVSLGHWFSKTVIKVELTEGHRKKGGNKEGEKVHGASSESHYLRHWQRAR